MPAAHDSPAAPGPAPVPDEDGVRGRSMLGQRVLVTGATGFIGSHLIPALVRGAAEIHGVSRRPPTDPGTHVRWHRADLADASAAHQVIADVRPDVVYHLASHVTGDRSIEAVGPAFHANLQSTVNLLTAVSRLGCARIVVAGSMEEPAEGAAQAVPASPYAAAKGAASSYARMFHALYGTPVVLARLFMVYGPGQRDLRKVIPYSILSLLSRRPLELSDGRRPVDWVFVADAVAGLLAAARVVNIEGQTVDLGSGDLTTVRAVIERLAALIDPAGDIRFGAVPTRPLEQVRAANVGETALKLRWRAATPLSTGLASTVEWYRTQLEAGVIQVPGAR